MSCAKMASVTYTISPFNLNWKTKNEGNKNESFAGYPAVQQNHDDNSFAFSFKCLVVFLPCCVLVCFSRSVLLFYFRRRQLQFVCLFVCMFLCFFHTKRNKKLKEKCFYCLCCLHQLGAITTGEYIIYYRYGDIALCTSLICKCVCARVLYIYYSIHWNSNV